MKLAIGKPSAERVLPRASLFIGISMSMTMNITAGLRAGRGGAVVAGCYALSLLVSLELLILVIRQTRDWTWERIAAMVLCGICAAVTGWVSYTHALEVLRATGGPHQGEVVYFAPVLPDQLILMGTVALIAVARRKRTVRTSGPDQKTRPSGKPKPDRESLAETELVELVLGMAKIPGQRAFAAAYCGGSRRMARRVLARAAAVMEATHD